MIIVDVIKTAYRQTKDGFAITLTLHPQDDHDELARAPIGSHWQIRAVPLDDDGNPQDAGESLGPPPSRRQAAIACNDPLFRNFLKHHGMLAEDTTENAAVAVRLICDVVSRSDIVPGTYAGDKWDGLYSKFQAWKLVPEDAA